MDTMLDKKDVAKLLKISERKIDYLRQNGELLWVKMGRSVRFRLEDVQDFVKKQLVVSTETKATKGGLS